MSIKWKKVELRTWIWVYFNLFHRIIKFRAKLSKSNLSPKFSWSYRQRVEGENSTSYHLKKKIIFLHWGENHFLWKIIFQPLLCQITENWKTIFRENHPPQPNTNVGSGGAKVGSHGVNRPRFKKKTAI